MTKKVDGYFTVEAAMVMPIVIGSIVVIMYLLFFQYNRCLMEQDVGVLALRGATMQAEDNQERIGILREQVDKLNDEKYIVWDCGEVGLKLEKGRVRVERDGMLKFAFGGLLNAVETQWMTSASYENRVLSPVSFIRSYRKLVGG